MMLASRGLPDLVHDGDQDEREYGAQAGRFRRCGIAAVEGDHDAGEQDHEGEDPGQQLHLVVKRKMHLVEIGRFVAAAFIGIQRGLVLAFVLECRIGREQKDEQDAGADTGKEQPAERLLRGNGVQDHRNRRREQDAERAARGNEACRESPRVAAPAHLGDARAADGRTGGRARSRHGGKERAGEDVGNAQAAGDPVHPGVDRSIEIGTGPGFSDGRSLQDKKRDREERDARHLFIDVLGDRTESRGRHEYQHEQRGDPAQGKGDRHAREHDRQRDETVQRADDSDAHGALLFFMKWEAICSRIWSDRLDMPAASSP